VAVDRPRRPRSGDRQEALRESNGEGHQARGAAGIGGTRDPDRPRRAGRHGDDRESAARCLVRPGADRLLAEHRPGDERHHRALPQAGLGEARLDRLRVPEIDRYYRRLLDGSANQGRPLGPATIRRLHGILRRAVGQAVRWGWIARNYAADASPPRVHAPEVRPPTPAEVARLFRLASGDDPPSPPS
jgi:hypothetical protein